MNCNQRAQLFFMAKLGNRIKVLFPLPSGSGRQGEALKDIL